MMPDADAALAVSSYTRTADAAWSSFVLGRLDALGNTSLRQQAVDIEIEMLRKYTAIALQRQNALRPVGRLPAELLSMIFAYAQSPPYSGGAHDRWLPRRYPVEVISDDKVAKTEEKTKTKQVIRFALGWLHVTHVCSAWRTAALHNPSLWQDITSFALPTRSVLDIVARAGTLPLHIRAHETTQDQLDAATLNTWLSSAVLRRAEILDISTCSEDGLQEWIPFLRIPILGLRNLSISSGTWTNADEYTFIPDDVLASQCPPALHSLVFRNCFPSWSSPLFSAHLTHLSLETDYVYYGGSRELFPAMPEFQHLLSVLTPLENLNLDEFLPVHAEEDNARMEECYVFPQSLRRLRVCCESPALLTEGAYRHFIERCKLPPTTIFIGDASMDETKEMEEEDHDFTLGSYLRPITQIDAANDQCWRELMLGRFTTGLRSGIATSGPPWTYSQHPTEQSRSIYTRSSFPAEVVDSLWTFKPDLWASGCTRGGRLLRYNWIDTRKYLHLFPLGSINTLSLLPNVMSLFPTADAWNTSFATALRIEHLSASYLRCVQLFSALSRLDSDSGLPILFPRLSTIIFVSETHPLDEHIALRVAVDISLLDIRAIRKEAGVPIRQLIVEKSMSEWDIWERIRDGPVVSFFESQLE
ncbi:hypothetical protein PENSPDRAFT_736545 [Peniophora sp. CONT]|nr:hypothetical protein PENSPDRAFT_736545 [Peniophora sp. CONT]